MRRLYLQFYLTVVGVLVLFAVLASLAWWMRPEMPRERRLYRELAELAVEMLPPPDAPADEATATLQRLGSRFSSDLELLAPDRQPIASSGRPLPRPPPHRTRSGWLHGRHEPVLALALPDGRWLVAQHQHMPGGGPTYGWLAMLALLAVAVAIGSYPVVRRLTGRLERLQARVDALGEGELSTRVQVEGVDEVADLAASFNRAADRIERLVNAQKTLLASASHELRSPLARMRVAIELLAAEDRPEIRDRVSRDIAELDELIGELLLASRLDAIEEIQRNEEVDLLALVAEEGARVEADVTGDPVRIRADARMLRRLVRNLLENARRHGGGTQVEARVSRTPDGGALLCVEDAGPGVAEAERERIFEPFYRPAGMRESSEGGVGLGLALVRQIARHHGGEAVCVPREGGGTRFEVTLAREAP
jgi:signal transduction histidine kinase